MGFCGVGMTVGGWVGNKLANQILGRAYPTAFEGIPFKKVPFEGSAQLYSKAGVGV